MKPKLGWSALLALATTMAFLGGLSAVAQIQVNSTNPAAAPQGTTTLNVTISGSGFKKGAKAAWYVTGTTNPGGVTVNSTTFNGSGQLTAPAANITGIAITGFVNGATNMTFNWNGFAGPQPTLTQLASPSTVANSTQDGYPSGTLVSFTVDHDGVVQGTFSNGQSRAIGEIALASFANPDGLLANGANSFQATVGSGTANIGAANKGGRGALIGGALELSNVDIAQEFARLILAQRGYEANARAVTTFDQVTQDTINLKQG